jgi:hypothetical protein
MVFGQVCPFSSVVDVVGHNSRDGRLDSDVLDLKNGISSLEEKLV